MTARTDDARKIAEAMKVRLDEEGSCFRDPDGGYLFDFPDKEWSRSAHLAFVGELAEAAGFPHLALETPGKGRSRFWVMLWDHDGLGHTAEAPDLAHAAVRAALAARGQP